MRLFGFGTKTNDEQQARERIEREKRRKLEVDEARRQPPRDGYGIGYEYVQIFPKRGASKEERKLLAATLETWAKKAVIEFLHEGLAALVDDATGDEPVAFKVDADIEKVRKSLYKNVHPHTDLIERVLFNGEDFS